MNSSSSSPGSKISICHSWQASCQCSAWRPLCAAQGQQPTTTEIVQDHPIFELFGGSCTAWLSMAVTTKCIMLHIFNPTHVVLWYKRAGVPRPQQIRLKLGQRIRTCCLAQAGRWCHQKTSGQSRACLGLQPAKMTRNPHTGWMSFKYYITCFSWWS